MVRDEDTDGLGHVNNIVWVRFIVRLADAHSRALGLDWQTIRGHGGIWLVRRHEIEYHRSALPGQELIETTWIESMRGARSIRRSEFTLADGDTPLVSAITVWAFCDPETQRPTRVPPGLLEYYPVRGA